MLGYILPTGNGRRILWYPAPRLPWGELIGLKGKVTLLTADLDVDVKKISMLTKDNIHRPVIRTKLNPFWRFYWVGRLMLWGVIWLIGIDNPLEDLVGGLYLLLGLPLFVALTRMVIQQHLGTVMARFEALAYSPKVELVYSQRLKNLEEKIDEVGVVEALDLLDEFGLRHLQEFYRRVAWQTRWETPPPTGAGVLSC
ncbi:hypothetical protein KA005_13540 [bacterium]|nr:hypothetical protein [bacterium]